MPGSRRPTIEIPATPSDAANRSGAVTHAGNARTRLRERRVTWRLHLQAVYQDILIPLEHTGTQASSMQPRARTETGTADVAVQQTLRSTDFLNRVHWFDSGRGHQPQGSPQDRRTTQRHVHGSARQGEPGFRRRRRAALHLEHASQTRIVQRIERLDLALAHLQHACQS